MSAEPAQPVEELRHLDVQPTRLPDGQIRVVVSDERCGLRLLSLTAADAAHLAGSLVVASARARGPVTRHEPGS